MIAITDDTSSVQTTTSQPGPAASNTVAHICLVSGNPKAPAEFIAAPIVESNSESLIGTWKDTKTIYGVLSLYIPGKRLALLIKLAFQGNTAENPEMLYVLLKRWNGDQDFDQLSAVQIPVELYYWLLARACEPSALQLEGSTYKRRIVFYSQDDEDVSVNIFYAGKNIRIKSGEPIEIETTPKLNDLGIHSKYPLSGYALLFVGLVAFILVMIYITASC